jgi:carboxymethylenebutenolidase
MRAVTKILLGLLIAVAVLVLLALGSIAVDALIGRGRIDALTNTQVTAEDGTPIGLYVARPEGEPPYAAVILIHEFYGLRPDIVEKAEALAAQGYLVVAPDTYRGKSTGWVPRAIWLRLRVPEDRVLSDLGVVYDWLAKQPDTREERIAVLGFCYGGGMALRYSLEDPRVAATIVFYGDPITDADRLQTLSGPVLGIFGALDRTISLEEVEAFEAALDRADVPNRIIVYKDVGHAFVSDMDTIAAGGAPAAAWTAMTEFLQEHLSAENGTE